MRIFALSDIHAENLHEAGFAAQQLLCIDSTDR